MTSPRFPISFGAGQVALAVRAGPGIDLPRAIRGMGLTTGVPTIVLVGAGSRSAQLDRLGPLLEKVVVRVADDVGATVVDDGGAGSVAALLGLIRARRKAGFPLVGVAPDDGRDADGAGLDPEHTHFVLVPAADREDVSDWIPVVTRALAGENRSLAVVAAGGEPAWADVAAHARDGRLVVAIARSGGVADHLAAAAAGRPADDRAVALVRSGTIRAVDPGLGAAAVADELRRALSRPDQLGPGPRPGG